MFFETRVNPLPISPAYQACCDAFLSGQVRTARKAAIALKGVATPSLNDLLLCADIARACGRRKEYAALGVLIRRRSPKDSRARIEYAQSLSNRSSATTAIRELTSLAEICEVPYIPCVQAMLAAAYAQAGFRLTAQRHSAKAEGASSARDPLASYHLSWMAMYLTDWKSAIEHGTRAVNLAPLWPQARVTLAYAHLAIGNTEEAEALLRESLDKQIEDESVDLTTALFEFSQGRIEVACTHFDRYRMRWAGASSFGSVMVTEAIARWSLGQPTEARTAAAASDSQLLELINKAQPNGHHCFIPVGYIAQKLNQCVPTSVAMITHAQGITLDADDLFRQMMGNTGTPLWRMRKVMQDAGYQVLCIKTETAILRHMLDLGIPLMGCTETLFGKHVELLCGYHSGLDIYFLRDPMVWHPSFITANCLGDRYSAFGGAVIVILSPENARRISIPPEWIADTATRLIDLEEACIKGDRETSEILANAIPDGTPAAILRDQLSYRVVIGPNRYQKLMKAHAFNPAIPPVLRWKILQQLGDRDASVEMHRMVNNEIRHPFYRDWAALCAAQADGAGKPLQSLILRMVERYPGLDFLWAHLSDLQAQDGNLAEARKSLTRALEISPQAPHLHERDTYLCMENLPYLQRLARAEELCQRYPDALELKAFLARVRFDDPDGLQYEASWKNYLRFFPRDPSAYSILADWYLTQDREDLARDILEEGRRLLDNIELPLRDFEQTGRNTAQIPIPAEKSINSDPETLLLEAARDLSEQPRTGNPDEWPSFRRLLELAQTHSLLWHQTVKLLSLRIRGIIRHQAQTSSIDARITTMLSSVLSDAPSMEGVTLFLEFLNINSLDRRVASTIHFWITTRLGSNFRFARLRFLMAILRRCAGLTQQSVEDIRQLCRDFPGYGQPLYYIARISAEQEKFSEAIDCYRRCLDNEPGHSDALNDLKTIYDMLAKSPDASFYHAQLTRRYPYSFDLFLEGVQRSEITVGTDRAILTAERMGNLMPSAFIAAAKSDLLIRSNRVAEATRMIQPFAALAGKLWPVHATLLVLALKNGSSVDIETLTEAGIIRWPYKSWLTQVYTEHLLEEKPHDAIKFIDKRFADGLGSPELAFTRLRASKPSEKYAIQSVLNTPEPHRTVAIECYATALNRPEWRDASIAFLEWCAHRAPMLQHLRYQLAIQYNFSLRHRDAQKVAKALLAEDPENPAYLHLMGRCLQDTDPKSAESYLTRTVQKDRSSEYLLVLGRNYQILGHKQRAAEIYREVVASNPKSTVALTNLYFFGENPRILKELIYKAINHGAHPDGQYFHVVAVLIAIATNSEVPEAWIAGATHRYNLLNFEAQFLDERERLSKALLAWHTVRNEYDLACQYGTRKEQSTVNQTWPGFRWIPKKTRS